MAASAGVARIMERAGGRWQLHVAFVLLAVFVGAVAVAPAAAAVAPPPLSLAAVALGVNGSGSSSRSAATAGGGGGGGEAGGRLGLGGDRSKQQQSLHARELAAEPNVQMALLKATTAAKVAWALTTEVEGQTTKNLEYVPLIEAEVALAKAAATTAAEEDNEATALLNETRIAAEAAATETAQAYYTQVKQAAAEADQKSAEMLAAAKDVAEVKVAKAVAKAAMPYHAMLLRGQRVVVDYQKRAQALGAVSSNLKVEGANLASAASQYQAVGQVSQASQLMMTAHSIFNQGDQMQKEAKDLRAAALEVYDSLPTYQAAEQAAAESAAAAANPPELPSMLPPY